MDTRGVADTLLLGTLIVVMFSAMLALLVVSNPQWATSAAHLWHALTPS